MADEVVVGSGKTLRVGDVDWVIVERETCETLVPSLITEARLVSNSVIYLSLAQTVVDGANAPEAHICVRLRLDLISAQVIRDNLSSLIDQAMKPADKSQAN